MPPEIIYFYYHYINLAVCLHFKDPIWRQTGRELQALAEDFARSRGRALVLQQAQQVNVTSLNKEKFCGLLEGLFEVIGMNYFSLL